MDAPVAATPIAESTAVSSSMQGGLSAIVQLILLAVSLWAATYARAALAPLQEAIRIDLALTDNAMAWLQGPAAAVPMAVGAIPLAMLAQYMPRKAYFVLFIAIDFLALMACAHASDLMSLMLARGMIGLANAALLVAVFPIVGELFPPQQRGRASGTAILGEVAATPAAFALGGMLLVSQLPFPIAEAETGWRASLMWMAVPIAVAALLMLAFLRNVAAGGSAHRPLSVRQLWPEILRYRALIIPLMLARVMVWIADGGIVVWGAPSLAREFGLPADKVAAILASAYLIMGIAGPVFGGLLADFCQRTGGPKRTVFAMAGVTALSVPVGLFAALPSIELAGIALTLFLIAGCMVIAISVALSVVVLPPELRGVLSAITITVGSIASIGIAPLAVSYLSGALGGPGAIGEALSMICAGLSVAGALIFLNCRRFFIGRS